MRRADPISAVLPLLIAVFTVAAPLAAVAAAPAAAEDFPKPYDPQCTERENVFEFAKKPTIHLVGKDKYEIAFAVKGYCDVTAAMIDGKGVVIRHLASGVLGKNAPSPFQKDSLEQKLYWNGKDDLDVYVKEPDNLKVRVMLGLKPEFDKALGPTSPKAIPGHVWGIAADEGGIYVFGKGAHMSCVRKFDHDGGYVRTIFPPAAGTPAERLGGMSFIEYEPGRRSIHGPDAPPTLHHGYFMPVGAEGSRTYLCRPAVANGRIYFTGVGSDRYKMRYGTILHWISTDGATDLDGMKGRIWLKSEYGEFTFLAASPDGKTLYLSGIGNSTRFGKSKSAVYRAPAGEDKPAEVFIGNLNEPGSDNAHLNDPGGVACDPKGRVYIADTRNNRVQIFSPEGTHLKTLKISNPRLIQIHQKTGTVYVAHSVRKGRSTSALTSFSPFPDLARQRHWEKLDFSSMTLDSWAPRPRFWVSLDPVGKQIVNFGETLTTPYSLKILEENGDKLDLVMDFDKEAEKEAAGNYHHRWLANEQDEVVCDPVRERVLYCKKHLFDLTSGRYLGPIPSVRSYMADDMAYDKHGYLHIVIPSGLDSPRTSGMGRLDSSRTERITSHGRKDYDALLEVPYDYGETGRGWLGAIKLYRTDHHAWTWGMGVNMQGDIAVVRDIEFVPSMPEESASARNAGRRARAVASGDGARVSAADGSAYAEFMRELKERQKTGEEFFIVKRWPGVDAMGSTIFTFDRTGEVRAEPAAVPGGKTLDANIDEDGKLYFLNQCARLVDGKVFLHGKAGWYGTDKKFTPGSGVYVKSQPTGVMFQWENSKTVLDPKPERPADMRGYGGLSRGRVWAKGVEWFYAGASPFPIDVCECPQMRVHLDWYKRSFVPEVYRHSIGVLDTNGNLVTHIGRYGNWDSGFGPKSPVRPGGDGIAMTYVRFLSGTDNYLVFSDRAERLAVLKLNYHAEETVPIR